MSDNILIVATKNKEKLKEIKSILTNFKVVGMEEAGYHHETVEDGTTFEENATKKAMELMKITNTPVLADDSGLIVDILNGEPGVYSSRYAGEEADDEANMQKILQKLGSTPENERMARFVCVMSLIYPSGDKIVVHGECDGMITTEKRGKNGFGYDPIFYVPEYRKTFAELSTEVKNQISHRRKALEKLKCYKRFI